MQEKNLKKKKRLSLESKSAQLLIILSHYHTGSGLSFRTHNATFQGMTILYIYMSTEQQFANFNMYIKSPVKLVKNGGLGVSSSRDQNFLRFSSLPGEEAKKKSALLASALMILWGKKIALKRLKHTSNLSLLFFSMFCVY